MKYKYNGTDTRVIPSLGIVVKSGDEFDAPDGFSAADVTAASGTKTEIKPVAQQASVTDKKLGE